MSSATKDLTIVKTKEELSIQVIQDFVIKKNELIENIISQLTIDPKSDGDELMKSFFTIAGNEASSHTISAFQNLYYILKDAETLKDLLQQHASN